MDSGLGSQQAFLILPSMTHDQTAAHKYRNADNDASGRACLCGRSDTISDRSVSQAWAAQPSANLGFVAWRQLARSEPGYWRQASGKKTDHREHEVIATGELR
jgi:hypothetical protein